jgi:hypothetical protein
MTDYTKSTNFASKDSLPSGDPLKIVKGTEINTEFDNIATAISTKYDSSFTIPITSGGTGATTASAARTALGVVIGTNVQAWDSDLDTWAGKTAPSGTVVGTTDTQTLTNKTLTTPTISGNANMTGGTKYQVGGVATNALAWVNFNGTGTVAIRSSYNVSSITDNGTGDYTVNFANALSDANYAPTFGTITDNTSFGGSVRSIWVVAQTTTTLQTRMGAGNPTTAADFPSVNIAIFGN